jgi:hypothetical protein
MVEARAQWGRIEAWTRCLVVVFALALSACGGQEDEVSPAPAKPVAWAGCESLSVEAAVASAPVAAQAPVMSISSSACLEPFPTSGADYADRAGKAFLMSYNAGARGLVSTWTWRDLEPGPAGGEAKGSELVEALGLSRDWGLRHYLGIQLINTTRRELPSDLEAEAWDSPRMVQRFKALLDTLLSTRQGRIHYLSVGNEVDAYFRLNPSEWAPYERFLAQMIDHAHALDPDIQVATTLTADGLLGASPLEAGRLASLGDVWMVTYYPLNLSLSGVTVRDPGVVAGDFRRLLDLAGNRKIVFQEVGYPAGTSLGSSEALQARFVDAALDAWHADRDRIPFLNFFLLHDFTTKICDDFEVYYGAAGVPGFKEFLCTLGLRKATGEPRQAWTTLSARTGQAGWQP